MRDELIDELNEANYIIFSNNVINRVGNSDGSDFIRFADRFSFGNESNVGLIERDG